MEEVEKQWSLGSNKTLSEGPKNIKVLRPNTRLIFKFVIYAHSLYLPKWLKMIYKITHNIKGKTKKKVSRENIKEFTGHGNNEVSDETKEDRSKTQTYCELKRE